MGFFGRETYSLTVTTLQAIILTLFNENATISYSDILERTQLKGNMLKPLLHSLSCGKTRILTKQPENPIVKETDTFQFNVNFRSEYFIQIALMQYSLKAFYLSL